MSLFPIAIITIFWQHDLGLSMVEIFGLQAILAGTTALLEFPSGYLADRIGYRPTLMIAAVCNLVGWTVYLFSPDFWTIACAEVVLGLGLSLVSGTDSAMMYESLAQQDMEGRFAIWHGRSRFFSQAAEGSAALAAGLLYAWEPRAPFALEIVVWVVGIAVASRLVEPERSRPVVEDTLRHVASIFGRIFRGATRLRAVMALSVVLSMTSFVPVWIIQIYAKDAGVSIAWLGPMWAVANYSVALGALASARLGRSIGLMPALLLCVGLAGAGYLGLALSTGLWGFVFYFAITLMRGLNSPLISHEEQKLLPSAERASFVSARSLLFRLLFVAIGPAVGAWMDASGAHTVLLGTGAVAVAAGLATWTTLLRHPDSSTLEAGNDAGREDATR